ncbi:MAG: thioredoxin [Ignavibacterium sp.]|nr:thioredoxin [Ignavibacterium sp.]MDW8375607.1 thioredoxin [Ignavibacteriales bacterium]
MEVQVKDFQKEVIEESYNIPILVDFWAEWCGPCRILGPILERLARKYEGQWKLVKIDTEEYPELAAHYGIRSIPNVKLFHKGKIINEFTGALPEKMIEDWLKKSIPNKYSEMIEKAKSLLGQGKVEDAKSILEDVHKGDITNSEVKILLAKILVFENPKEAKRLVESSDVSDDYFELANAILTFIELFDKYDNDTYLPEDPVKQLYLNAIKNLLNKNFENALENFIDVIRENKSYDDEGARKACIAIFKYLGEENEITLKYRRDFGRALYV